MSALAVGLLAAALAPPAQLQADTYRDDRHFDQPGLYAVLADAAAWPDDAEAASIGATVPNTDALLTDPAAHRGTHLLLRATAAGRARRLDLLRNGAWDNPITEWGIHLAPDATQPAVLLLTDTPPTDSPAPGSRLTAPARFLGLWRDADATGSRRDYPVFITRGNLVSIEASTADPAQRTGTALSTRLLPLLALLAAAALVVWRLRRFTTARRPPPPQRLSPTAAPDPLDDTTPTDLPADPAEALRELARRRGS